jgi:hypothetical protein
VKQLRIQVEFETAPKTERHSIMTKSILVVALAVAGTVVFADTAQARGRRCYRTNAVYANPTWVSNTATIAPATQANTGSAYQSYSYEPGQAPAPATTVAPARVVAPVAVYPNTFANRSSFGSEYNDVIRGDRKVRGHTAEAE